MHTVLTSQPLICTTLHGLLHHFNFPPKCQVIHKGMQDALSFHSVKTNQVDVTLDSTRCCRETAHHIWCYSWIFFFFSLVPFVFFRAANKNKPAGTVRIKVLQQNPQCLLLFGQTQEWGSKMFPNKKLLFRERRLAEMKECSIDEHMVQSCSFFGSEMTLIKEIVNLHMSEGIVVMVAITMC